jgi:hypothetical protein
MCRYGSLDIQLSARPSPIKQMLRDGQYVSKRHRESLKAFKKWRKREDVQERMKALRLLEPSKQLEVYDYLEN